jgi:sirohydrochlorin cobaltochelatase
VDHRTSRVTTLILLGHGSSGHTGSGAPVYQHAAEMRRRNVFADVREAFWKQTPQIRDVLETVTTQCVCIVPLFISAGYFTDEVIPHALGFGPPAAATGVRELAAGSQTVLFTQPVGTHPAMGRVLLQRAREVVERFPFPRAPQPADLTLFVLGHGTDQNENSSQAIEAQVQWLRTERRYAAVHAVYLDQAPRIPECYGMAETRHLVLVPFFISDGMHVQEDIPVLLGEPERIVRQRLQSGQSPWRNPTEKQGKLVWYASSVGTDPAVAEVILERAKEGATPTQP